jgi:hypothetical protein
MFEQRSSLTIFPNLTVTLSSYAGLGVPNLVISAFPKDVEVLRGGDLLCLPSAVLSPRLCWPLLVKLGSDHFWGMGKYQA